MTKDLKVQKLDNLEIKVKPIDWRVPDGTRTYELKLERFGTIYVDHETYKNYMKPIWAEWQMKRLEARCRVKSEKGNFFKRCDKDCSKCEFYKSHHRTGKVLSLDQLYEESEYEAEDKSINVVAQFEAEERKNMVREAIAELEELDQIIINGFSEGLSDSKIAKQLLEDKSIKMSQQAINKRKIKCFIILKEILLDMGIWL